MTNNDNIFPPKTNDKGECIGCVERWPMRHEGSTRCKSGSLASGGNNSHCTCDTCF